MERDRPEDCLVPQGQEAADGETSTTIYYAATYPHDFYQVKPGHECRLKDLTNDRSAGRVSAACFHCGQGVHLIAERKIVLDCAGFGTLEPGKLAFDKEAGNGFGKMEVSLGNPEKSNSTPSRDKDKCLIRVGANRFLKAVKENYWGSNPTAEIACSGFCEGCGNNISLSMSAKRLP